MPRCRRAPARLLLVISLFPDTFWWILMLGALFAALLLGPAGRLVERPGDFGVQGPAATDYRNWRPVGPFAY